MFRIWGFRGSWGWESLVFYNRCNGSKITQSYSHTVKLRLKFVQSDSISKYSPYVPEGDLDRLTHCQDVLVCMGLVDAAKDGIGLEGAGVVRGVGAHVGDLKVGDRVMLFEHGCFSTRIAILAKLCAKIPGDLSFEEAATLPCVYSTVIHSLLTVGKLEKGQVRYYVTLSIIGLDVNDDKQTVLIQSACGGVGLAAIQICKMIGAKVGCFPTPSK